MKFVNNVIALVMAALILTGVALPSLGAAFPELNGPSEVPLTYLTGDALDDMTMTLKTDGGHVSVVSATWTGTIRANAIIVYTDKGSVYTDGTGIYSAFGNAVKTYAQLTVSLDSGTISVGTDSYPVTYAYWPWTNGDFGSYSNGTVTDPIVAVGSFAGVAVSGSGTVLTTNTSDYIIETVMETDDRKSIGFVPGTVNGFEPLSPHQQMQAKPGLDLDDIDLEQGVLEKINIEKGDITIIPGKGEIIGDIDMEDVIVTPGKLPAESIQAVGNATSGTTGQCTWELDGDTLYIRGNGQTADYSYNFAQPEAPWPLSITHLVVEEGVTRIGTAAFLRCNLETVELPSTLTSIKNHAFRYCYNLKEMNIPASLTELASNCLASTAIQQLILPDSFTIFGVNCIFNCNNLVELYIPATLTSPGSQTGASFTDIDGTDGGVTPRSGVYYTGPGGMVFYESVEDDVGDYGYQLTYVDARLTRAANIAEVMVPYTVEYNGRTVPVTGILGGAVSGSAIRHVVIPQTVEYISATAMTSPSIKEILNLSETEVTSISARIASELPTVANIADSKSDNSFGFYSMLIGIVVVICLIGMAVKLLPTRRGDWE